jgi:excisionase family DNA binding protein
MPSVTMKLLTIKEIAERYGLNPRTVQLWAKIGKIPAINLGSKDKAIWRFKLEDLERWEGKRKQ